MSGREEQDAFRNQLIREKLEGKSELLKDYMLSIKNKTSSTRIAYLGYIDKFLTYLEEEGLDVTEVKPRHIDRYIDMLESKGNGDAVINAKHSAITSFYKFLVKNDLAPSNPCDSEQKRKVHKKSKVVYMTDNEIEQVKLNAVSSKVKYRNRDLCIVTLGCATGLRVSAIRNIDIEDIDFFNKEIRVVEKGDEEREVLIGDNTIKIIRDWMADREKICGNNTGPLFISQKKNRMAVRTIEAMIAKATNGLDKHITPHKMRSTCAMRLYEMTGDIYLTAQQLGHKNIKNTMIYAKSTDEKRREAATLLD